MFHTSPHGTDPATGAREVLGIGAATWDRFVVVPEFPSGDGVTQALTMSEQGGGPGFQNFPLVTALPRR